MTFPKDILRCVWVWAVDRGWRGIRCVAVEPWIGYPARLDEARAAGRARTLAPAERLVADTRLIGFHTREPISGFDDARRPLITSASATA